MAMMNKQLYYALLAAKVPEKEASEAAESVAEYHTAMNDLKQTVVTEIKVLNLKLNLLMLIAIIPAAKALGFW